jgi:hypothetical protein
LFTSAVTAATHSLVQRTDRYYSSGKSVTVPIWRAADLIRRGKVRSPDVVKVDVEGAEGAVLTGFADIPGEQLPRVFFLEVHPALLANFDTSLEILGNWLTERGYAVREQPPRGTERYWLATRTPHNPRSN